MFRFLKLGLVFVSTTVWGASPSLVKVADIPLPGKATRFDYQSFNRDTGILYFSHMGDGELIVFDTAKREVLDHLPGLPTITGVLTVPELHRVFASVAGEHEITAIDSSSLKVVSRIKGAQFPDGLAYASDVRKLYVSDESGEKELVIDPEKNVLLKTIEMGGEVGNTQYDPFSHLILANVQTRNELVVIDPSSDKIVGRHRMEGSDSPHGLLIDPSKRLAFIACEGNSKLIVIDLETFEVKQSIPTGRGPDVLAFDPDLERLYVATESDIVSIFHLNGKTVEKIEDLMVAPNAHTISVNPLNHEVYLPLKNVEGRPVLRIMKPSSPSPSPSPLP